MSRKDSQDHTLMLKNCKVISNRMRKSQNQGTRKITEDFVTPFHNIRNARADSVNIQRLPQLSTTNSFHMFDRYSLNFFFFLRFYLFEREREHVNERKSTQAQTEGGAEGEGEAASPLGREPDIGLDPRTLRSRPDPDRCLTD